MNFKKFISGVSALAIAASAFAGMAVTANAATQSLWSEDFESATEITGWTNLSDTDGTYGATTMLASNKGGNSTKFGIVYGNNAKRSTKAHYYFTDSENNTTPLTSNNFVFEADLNMNTGNNSESATRLYFMSSPTNQNTNAEQSNYLFALEVSTDKSYLMAKSGNAEDTEITEVAAATGYNSDNLSFGTIVADKNYKSTGWFHIKANVSFTNSKIYLTVTKGTGERSYTLPIKTGSQFSGLSVLTGNKIYGAVGFDNINAYYETPETVTVKYMSGTTELYSKSTTISEGTIAGNQSYSFPKYYADGTTLYSASANYSGTITTTTADTIIEKEYTATGTTGYFFEGENNGGDGTKINDARLSGGSAVRHISASRSSYKVITATAPAAGVYKVTVCGLTNGSGKGSKLTVYKNSTDDTNKLGEIDINSNTINYIKTVEVGTVALNANESIIVKGNDENSAVDYILLEKIGDVASAKLNETAKTYDTYDDPTVKAYTFDATPKKIGSEYQALNSVTVTVKVEGYEDRVQTKTAAEFGTISGPATFAILIAGAENPTITVTAN